MTNWNSKNKHTASFTNKTKHTDSFTSKAKHLVSGVAIGVAIIGSTFIVGATNSLWNNKTKH